MRDRAGGGRGVDRPAADRERDLAALRPAPGRSGATFTPSEPSALAVPLSSVSCVEPPDRSTSACAAGAAASSAPAATRGMSRLHASATERGGAGGRRGRELAQPERWARAYSRPAHDDRDAATPGCGRERARPALGVPARRAARAERAGAFEAAAAARTRSCAPRSSACGPWSRCSRPSSRRRERYSLVLVLVVVDVERLRRELASVGVPQLHVEEVRAVVVGRDQREAVVDERALVDGEAGELGGRDAGGRRAAGRPRRASCRRCGRPRRATCR